MENQLTLFDTAPSFSAQKMRKLAKRDPFIRFAVNQEGDDERGLEIVFNSYVVDDAGMIAAYERS